MTTPRNNDNNYFDGYGEDFDPSLEETRTIPVVNNRNVDNYNHNYNQDYNRGYSDPYQQGYQGDVRAQPPQYRGDYPDPQYGNDQRRQDTAQKPPKYDNDKLTRDLVITAVLTMIITGILTYISYLVVNLIDAAVHNSGVVAPSIAMPITVGFISGVVFAVGAGVYRLIDSASDVDKQYNWIIIALAFAVCLTIAASTGMIFNADFTDAGLIVATVSTAAGLLTVPTRFANARNPEVW